jgi:hypothetical protein
MAGVKEKFERKPDRTCRKKIASKTGPSGPGLMAISAANIPGR